MRIPERPEPSEEHPLAHLPLVEVVAMLRFQRPRTAESAEKENPQP